MKTRTFASAPLATGLALVFGASAAMAQEHAHPAAPVPAMQDHAQHQGSEPAQDHVHPAAPVPTMQDHAQHQASESSRDHAQPDPDAAAHDRAQESREGEAAQAHPTTDHGAHGPPAQVIDHAAMGHAPPAEPVDHAAMGHAAPRPVEQPRTPIPPVTEADRAAAVPPADDHPVHDNGIHSLVLFNRLEGFDADEGRGVEWEGQAWIGTDLDRLWLRSEGERARGDTEAAGIEVLYGRAIARWWDVVAGIRHDFEPGASQDFAAIGVVGLAPYKFEVEATAYIGQSGQTAARLEAEYETLFTDRLILQSLLELNAYGRDDARRGIGSGLSGAEAGMRLRYEITRQFAPYVGVVRAWSFGRTADFRRDEGEAVNDTRLVAGLRIWF